MKAKRRLSNFDFSKGGCHVSLVGSSLGGPANGVTTLLMKSLTPSGDNKSPNDGEGNEMEMIEKSAVDVMVQKAVDDAVAPYKAELDALKAEKISQVEKARKEQLAAIVGEAEVEKTFMAIKSLDDNSFELVLKGFASAKTVEAKSGFFTEKGVTGSVDASKVEESAEMKALKAKYATK
jgi:hypothetical protein